MQWDLESTFFSSRSAPLARLAFHQHLTTQLGVPKQAGSAGSCDHAPRSSPWHAGMGNRPSASSPRPRRPSSAASWAASSHRPGKDGKKVRLRRSWSWKVGRAGGRQRSNADDTGLLGALSDWGRERKGSWLSAKSPQAAGAFSALPRSPPSFLLIVSKRGEFDSSL